MRVLVIGSSCFTATHVIKACLERGWTVWGVSRSEIRDDCYNPLKWGARLQELSANYRFSIIDINKDLDDLKDLVNSFEPSYILNYAGQGMVAQSWKDSADWYETNLLAQVRIILT